MTIRCLLPEDRAGVANLLTACFAGHPTVSNMGNRCAALRDAGDMPLELIWTEGAQIGGHIGFLRHESPSGWWALTCLAVHPRLRRRGVADALVRQGLDLARQSKVKAVTVAGDPAFFRPFGVSRKAAENLSAPLADAPVLVYPIRPGTAGLTADLTYPSLRLPA
jgi:putative acetyltransferase